MSLINDNCCLYRHFDKDGKIIYIGISNSFFVRHYEHMVAAMWRDKICSITIERFSTRKEAMAAEKEAIKKESPFFNYNYNEQRKEEALLKKIKKAINND